MFYKRSVDDEPEATLTEDPGKRYLRFGRSSGRFEQRVGTEVDADANLKRQFLRYGRNPDGEKRYMRFGKRAGKTTKQGSLWAASPQLERLSGITRLIKDDQQK